MNDLILIKKISERFHNARNSIHFGTVISSFSKVVNIMTPMGVFTLQESSVPFSPISIVLEDSIFLQQFGIKPNDTVLITETNISCHGLSFSFDNASIIDTLLQPYSPKHCKIELLPWYIDILRDKLMEYNGTVDAGGLMDISNHMEILNGLLVFRGMTSENTLMNYFQSKIEGNLIFSSQMATSIASLIGLGFGLTPSCDDFVVGLLSTLTFFGQESSNLVQFRDYLVEEIKLRLLDTTPVSSAFLEAAIFSDFSEMILNFYHDFNHPDEVIRMNNIDQIASIGHSSGIDSLNGINFGFKFISSLLKFN